jgi:SAM-dependent methyltransferase
VSGPYNKRSHDAVWSALKGLCGRWPYLGKLLEFAGQVASYAHWQRARGLHDGARYRDREQLWRGTSKGLHRGCVTVLEFGVASGAAARYWLSMIPNPELRWHGFDTFTGLPDPWMRGGIQFADRGEFDAGGNPPDISDSRVTWHAGRIEHTLPVADIDFSASLLVLFDLDLYEPSAFALESITGHLKPGDLLYFDEAFDPWHERRLLDEFLDQGHRVRTLGSTGVALMLEYEGGPK